MMTGSIEGLRLVRARWRQLDQAARLLEQAGHDTAAQVRHDADRLGRAEYTVLIACTTCRRPTPVRLTVAEPAGPGAADGMLLMSGGEPEAVVCGRCNAEATAEVTKICIGCEAPKGQPHQRWCPVVTGTLATLPGGGD